MNKAINKRTGALTMLAISSFLSACMKAPEVKEFEPPEGTDFTITSTAPVSASTSIMADVLGFRTLHGGTQNRDEVTVALAPSFELAWTTENQFWVYEGPSFDDQDQLYFSPIRPAESVNLVALDANTGERAWAIEGSEVGQGGAPLILNDPDNIGEQIIYTASYESIKAVNQAGDLLWSTPTGEEPNSELMLGQLHNYGVNYLPQQDALVSVVGTGKVFILDRQTGTPLINTFQIPGVATVSNPNPAGIPDFVNRLVYKAANHFFQGGATLDNAILAEIANMLLGLGTNVANYFAVSQSSGRIWIAATAPDSADGDLDGVSQMGALYGLDLIAQEENPATLEVSCSIYFPGGSASTPSISADGQRIYVADNFGKLYALDNDCDTHWEYDAGSQIVGSVAVAKDNSELYLSTTTAAVKLIDAGDQATLAWSTQLDLFELSGNNEARNANLVTIGSNGVYILAGAGMVYRGEMMPATLAVALLDRETGSIRYATKAAEETMSVISVAPSGELYIANSPLRRLISTLISSNANPVTGGISRYQTTRYPLLIRDASCSAADLSRFIDSYSTTASTTEINNEVKRLMSLIQQLEKSAELGSIEGTVDEQAKIQLEASLDLVTSLVSSADFTQAATNLTTVCDDFSPGV